MSSNQIDALISDLAVSFTPPTNTATEHPRFSSYKNHSKATFNQGKRRLELLNNQKQARFDYVSHARKLAFEDSDLNDEVEGKMDCQTISRPQDRSRYKHQNRYKDQLMLSEWLIDIPSELSSDWLMVPCPQGHRCLVVASNGLTNSYTKAGHRTNQFQSHLPGGNRGNKNGYTILDCVFDKRNGIYYGLDLICWNGNTMSASETDCRFFFLHSCLKDNENFSVVSQEEKNAYRFLPLEYCECEREKMEKLVESQFDYKLDGFLFYSRHAFYHQGVTPLVGWLKPFMLPELLQISVPEQLMDGHENVSAHDFIEKFNATVGYRHFRNRENKTTKATAVSEEDVMISD